jgi:hypothetical protein
MGGIGSSLPICFSRILISTIDSQEGAVKNTTSGVENPVGKLWAGAAMNNNGLAHRLIGLKGCHW